MKTPLKDIKPSEATVRLTQIVQQAYHRRSRNLPNNLHDIVETLKGDLLKAFPDVPIEVVDDAIVMDTHDGKTLIETKGAIRRHHSRT